MSSSPTFPWLGAGLVMIVSIGGGVGAALHFSGNAPWSQNSFTDEYQFSDLPKPFTDKTSIPHDSGTGKAEDEKPHVPLVTAESLLEELDSYSHPLYPNLPESVSGTEDESVASIEDDTVDRLLKTAPGVISTDSSSHRQWFNLGRIALLHSRYDEASQFLELAEKKGSMPAKYYLGAPELYENPSSPAALVERLQRVAEAEKSGFKPTTLKFGEKLTEEVHSFLDEKLAHPQDNQKLPHVFGVPDDELKWLNGSDLSQLVKGFGPYIESDDAPPRFLFGLGRVALVHENYAAAKQYFERAAAKGSGGAMAYLARLPENEKNHDFIVKSLESAIDAGFSDYTTQKALADAIKNRQEKRFNVEIFKGKEVIRHLYTGDVRTLLVSGAPLPLPMEPEILTRLQLSLTLKYVTALSAFLEREEAGFLAGPQSTMVIGGNAGAVGNMKLQQTSAAAQLLMASKLYGPMSALSGLSKGDPASVNNSMGILFRGFFGDGFEGPMNSNMELIESIAHSDARKLIAYYHAGTTEPIEKIYESIVQFVTDFK